MTVDLDLIRSLLLRIEKLVQGEPFNAPFEGYGERSLCDCVRFLASEGYLDADLCWAPSEEQPASVRLTWMGVVLVNAIRNDTVWSRVKHKLGDGAIGRDPTQLRVVLEDTAIEMAGEPLIDTTKLCEPRIPEESPLTFTPS